MRKFWKKVWIFVKEYWYIFLIVVLFLIGFLAGKNKDLGELFDTIRRERDIAKKERKLVDLTEDRIDKEIKKNREKFKKKVDGLVSDYKNKREKLEKEKVVTKKEMVQAIRKNPNKTLKQIADEMGWTYEE